MDSQDHKTATSSTGHEAVHGVHLCHRCGWPFPNPHPSAKHRRAHKRHCGTIEGYKIIHSEEHDHHLVVSDDDQPSDDDEHTPNSGVSPQSLERFESATGMNKNTEQKSSENHGIETLKVYETSDKTKGYNDAANSKAATNTGASVTVNDHSGIVVPITDSRAEAVPIGLGNNSQDDVIKSEIPRIVEDNAKRCVNEQTQHEQKKDGHDSDVQRQEQKSACVYVDSNEGIVSNPALIVVESKEELHDKLVPEMVEPHLLPQTETLQNKDASVEAETAAVSEQISCLSRTAGEIAPAKEAHENTSVSIGVEKVSASAEDVKSIGAAGDILHEENLLISPSEGTVSQDAIEPSNIAFSAIEESKQKSSLAEVEPAAYDASNGENHEADGNENGENKTSEDNFLIERVSTPGSADGTCAAGDDRTAEVKVDGSYSEEKFDLKGFNDAIEKDERDSEEVIVIVDPTSDKPTDFPCSTKADSSATYVEELSKSKSSTLESNLENSIPGQSSDKLNEDLPPVGYVCMDAALNHHVEVLDEQSGTGTSEYPMPQVISESPNNIHVPSNVGLESAPVTGEVEEIKDTTVIVASGSTSEQLISGESTLTNSELAENSVKEDRCTGKGIGELDNAELIHDDNVSVHKEISERPNQTQQENLSAKKCSNEILPDAEKRQVSEEISTTKPSFIVLNAEQNLDANVAASEKSSAIPSLNEAVPSSLYFQVLHKSSAASGEKNVVNVARATPANSKSLQDEDVDKVRNVVTAVDHLDNSSIKSETEDGNCGVVSVPIESNSAVTGTKSPSPDSLRRGSQQDKTTTEEAQPDKSDVFEPPSFMTLESSGKHDQVSTPSEIEAVQNNKHPKTEALQAGRFPSLNNVVNESDGRNKNEEIIAKVTSSSPVKHHSPLKNLLNEAKSPTTKQAPPANLKPQTKPENNGAGVTTLGSVAAPEAPTRNDHDTHKDIDEWNSPARYPIETKKEKKKGKSIWVPFMCCSSLHKDL